MPIVLHAWTISTLVCYTMINLNYTSLPFHFYVCSCPIFSFAMITLLVGADGNNVGDRSDGGNDAI